MTEHERIEEISRCGYDALLRGDEVNEDVCFLLSVIASREGALQLLLRFTEALLVDIGVSKHYASVDRARKELEK